MRRSRSRAWPISCGWRSSTASASVRKSKFHGAVHPTHWLISAQVDDGGGSILSGATALRTGTVNAGGEKISVGCLIRLEMNEAAGAFRLTVRTAVPHVSTALAEAIQKLL